MKNPRPDESIHSSIHPLTPQNPYPHLKRIYTQQNLDKGIDIRSTLKLYNNSLATFHKVIPAKQAPPSMPRTISSRLDLQGMLATARGHVQQQRWLRIPPDCKKCKHVFCPTKEMGLTVWLHARTELLTYQKTTISSLMRFLFGDYVSAILRAVSVSGLKTRPDDILWEVSTPRFWMGRVRCIVLVVSSCSIQALRNMYVEFYLMKL